jgi:hypothetical protein
MGKWIRVLELEEFPVLGKALLETLWGSLGIAMVGHRAEGSRYGNKNGWPIQARFWLEWGCFDLLNSVIPTGAE